MIKPNYFLEYWTPPKGWRALLGIAGIILLILGIAAAVYFTGGVQFVTIHGMYIPILIAAFFFGVRGGMIAGIICGLVAGPYLPHDTHAGVMQETLNWSMRMGVFTFLGGIAGYARTLLLEQLERVRWIADHNIQTGLHSRHHLEKTLQEKLKDKAHPFYLVVLAVDNFNEITDTFGYQATDQLMSILKDKISKRFNDIHYFSQYHPERLAIIAPKDKITKEIQADHLLMKLMTESVSYEGLDIHLHGIVGYAESDFSDEMTPLRLIQMADAALFYAKKMRLPRIMYSADIESVSKETMQYLGQLDHAIKDNELVLYYQPKMDFKTLKCLGAEVLIRWNSPTLGFIPPDKFIPQAEQTELIQELTRWIIRQAFMQQALWNKQGHHPRLSINLATKNLNDETLLGFIQTSLKEKNLDPHSIDFEITESAIMDDPDKTINFFKELKKMGFRLSIDDYGKGYASLAYLKYLPIDTLKIDMAFIQGIEKDKHSQEITKSTIAMAHGLDLTVVAEGVETEEGAALLQTMGCDIAQGYLYGKPMPWEDFEAFFTNHKPQQF